jgi:FixJ family two-component response regulator
MANEMNAIVYVVDDDEAILDSLRLLLKSAGLECGTYSNATDFLNDFDTARHGCLLADIRMPGMSGLELQDELNRKGIGMHGDVPMAVRAMKSGALDFIQKPFRDEDLLKRINDALNMDLERLKQRRSTLEVMQRFETLTPRETEVMRKVVEGCANKVIAFDLGVSQRTVELHRARVMHKMGVRSLAELVRMSGQISEF